MINASIGKEILDALFNIKLYGEEDKKERMIKEENGVPIEYNPYEVKTETKVEEQDTYSGIVKTSFDLTKASPYYEYMEFRRAIKEGSGGTSVYVTYDYFTLKETNPNHVEFPLKHYVGLFTEMPSFDNPLGTEPESSDYKRINMHRGIISGDMSVGEAYVDEETGGAAVSNHEIMVFPESNVEGGWGTIVGFGLFEDQVGGSPMFWGRLKQPVVVGKAQVPLFRIGDFKIILA